MHRLPIKQYAPIASVVALSERLAGWQVIGQHRRPYPPCRGGALPLPALHCRPVQAVVKMVMASDLSLRGRFAPVAISQYPVGSWGSYRRNRSCRPEIATAPSGPRNDKSGYLKPWNPCQRNRNCLWRSLSAATFSLARWACAGNAATDAIGLYALSLPL